MENTNEFLLNTLVDDVVKFGDKTVLFDVIQYIPINLLYDSLPNNQQDYFQKYLLKSNFINESKLIEIQEVLLEEIINDIVDYKDTTVLFSIIEQLPKKIRPSFLPDVEF